MFVDVFVHSLQCVRVPPLLSSSKAAVVSCCLFSLVVRSRKPHPHRSGGAVDSTDTILFPVVAVVAAYFVAVVAFRRAAAD